MLRFKISDDELVLPAEGLLGVMTVATRPLDLLRVVLVMLESEMFPSDDAEDFVELTERSLFFFWLESGALLKDLCRRLDFLELAGLLLLLVLMRSRSSGRDFALHLALED